MSIVKKIAGLLVGVVSLSSMGNAFAANAGTYPDRSVKLIVPFAAAGIADTLARIVAQHLAEKWKQSVIVENKPGAAGNIGMSMGAKAAPDGYTLVLAPVGNLTVNELLFTKLTFKVADFAPITELAASPNVLVVGKKMPVKSFAEFISYAKANPDKVDFSSPGIGSGAHLAGELLKQMAGINMLHVPYAGMSPALNDVIAGNVSAMFAGISTVLPYIKDGKLTALAVAGPEQLPELPGVPTVSDSGYKGFDVTSWYGLITQKNVPQAIVQKIQKDVAAVLSDVNVKNKLSALGVTTVGSTPEDFSKKIAADTKNWGAIIKKANIKPLQ